MSHHSIMTWSYFAAVTALFAGGIWYLGRKHQWGRVSLGMLLAAVFVLVASLLFVEGATLGLHS